MSSFKITLFLLNFLSDISQKKKGVNLKNAGCYFRSTFFRCFEKITYFFFFNLLKKFQCNFILIFLKNFWGIKFPSQWSF